METEYKHIWKQGEWSRKEGWWQRQDKCILCGCTRVVTRKNKTAESEIVLFERSKIITQIELSCWGGKTPK